MPAGQLNRVHASRAVGRKQLKRKPRFSKLRRATAGTLMRSYLVRDPMPPSRKTAFTYTEEFDLTSAAIIGLTGAEAIYRLNDLHQPHHGGGGTSHQPYGWDQMKVFYRRYKVYAIGWKIEFSNPSADGMYGVVMLQPAGSTGVTVNLTDGILREQPMTQVKYINNTGSQRMTISGFSPLYKIEGLKKIQYDAAIGDNYSADTSGSPALNQYMRVNAGDTTGTGGLTLHCCVKLTYYAELYDRKVLGQS